MLAPDVRQIHDEAVVAGGRVVQRKLHGLPGFQGPNPAHALTCCGISRHNDKKSGIRLVDIDRLTLNDYLDRD